MNILIDLLKKGDIEEIQKYLTNKELEFYNNDSRSLTIGLGFSIPNYDILINLLGIKDNEEPEINDTFGDESYFKIVTCFKTNIRNAYFIREEEYGPRDEDAMRCLLVFSDNLEQVISSEREWMSKKSIIRERSKNIDT